jgi:hypothetical protein
MLRWNKKWGTYDAKPGTLQFTALLRACAIRNGWDVDSGGVDVFVNPSGSYIGIDRTSGGLIMASSVATGDDVEQDQLDEMTDYLRTQGPLEFFKYYADW